MRIPPTPRPAGAVAAAAASQTPEERKLLRAILSKQREVQLVEAQLDKAAGLSALSIKVLQNLKAAHETALAKLLAAATALEFEKAEAAAAAKGEAE